MRAVTVNPFYATLNRQVNHWFQAALQLKDFERLASGIAWQGIDHSIANLIRNTLHKSILAVLNHAEQLRNRIESLPDTNNVPGSVFQDLLSLRTRYLKAEETIHFYTTAINSRTTPNMAALLRACDILCLRSMRALLDHLKMPSPYVLTYVEYGIGASILKANLRLWDGNVSSVAAVKVTRHNLFRPTAIIHETGHQVAHILNWNQELAAAFMGLPDNVPETAKAAFASWAGEIVADAFAFVHCGYASVAALHDVISGSPETVFAFHAHDPHPIGYIRVLMNIEMCRQFYGEGPWDDLQSAFTTNYKRSNAQAADELIGMCTAVLPEMVRLTLKKPFRAFGNKPLTAIIDPAEVSPQSLLKLQEVAGPALYTSHAWIWKECIRLLAHNGYFIALGTGNLPALYKQQEEWMIRLGFSTELN